MGEPRDHRVRVEAGPAGESELTGRERLPQLVKVESVGRVPSLKLPGRAESLPGNVGYAVLGFASSNATGASSVE